MHPTADTLALIFANHVGRRVMPGVRLLPLSKLNIAGCYTLCMEFEWDGGKAAANLAKHGVSFEEARTVFGDPLYVDFYDPDHSSEEHRYIIIGESRDGRLLLVSYTERDKVTRLISAREVTRSEREAYEEG